MHACWTRPATGWQNDAAGVGKGASGVAVGGGVTVTGSDVREGMGAVADSAEVASFTVQAFSHSAQSSNPTTINKRYPGR